MGSVDDEIAAHFCGFPAGLAVCRAIVREVGVLEESSIVVSKSQIAFRRRHAFAWVWRPGQYVESTVPAVLSFALPHELESERLKSVVHPAPGVWMHHLELTSTEEVDEEVRGWLEEAYRKAA